jgi:two-component sensor histidine kinase
MQIAYFASTVLFLASLVHLTIGSNILLNNRSARTNRAFFFLSLSLFFWALFYGITYLAGNGPQTLFWTRVLTVPTFFYPSLFLYLALIFPEDDYRPSWPFLLYHSVFIVMFLASVFSDNYISYARLVPQGIDFKIGLVYNLLGLYIVSTMLYGCDVLIRKLYRLSGNRRAQVLYVCLGAFISILLGALFGVILPIMNVPQYNFFAPAGTIFVIIFWGYAIVKHELMDLRVAISRSAAYGFVGILIVASFVGLNAVPLRPARVMIGNAVLALFWAFAAHRLRQFIQTPLEEKWITDWYDSDKLVNRIATRLIPVMEKQAVYWVIAEELTAAIKIKSVDILTGKQARDFSAVQQTKAGLLLPLSSSEGPEGALVLGQKVSEDPYDEKDRTVLTTIMVQARAIFDRIRPYEQVKRELQAIEQQLERSRRLAALGTIASGVAHEIRNPLGVIHAAAEELTDKPRTPEEFKPLQALILKNSRRISSIITNLLGLAKSKNKDYHLLDLNKMVEAVLQSVALSRVRLIKELQPIPRIKGDAEEIKQVLINLINNALEAMPEMGTLTLKTYQADGCVYLKVTDTGKGIPEENLEKIFDPFFSTRQESAGLGLSIVYRIVQEHGAKIEVRSAPGQGADFLIRFPAS